ncbi:MAG: type II toxin-antitoxin system PemK/MazF family toxin [bacterium]|nr:type II toxin-antitoxin system PemK/MazF family toxin [bacterium]
MANFNKGEVWFVGFPYEEDNSKISNRPVVVLDEHTLGVLSVKVTKHAVRESDEYDTPILYWQQAGLRFASTARVSKVMNLDPEDFIFKIGDLHPDDLNEIERQYINLMNKNRTAK